MACGRGALSSQNIEYSKLMDWVSHCRQSGQVLEAMDRNLNSFYNVEEGKLVLTLGLLCTLYNPELRPSMRHVSWYLNGDDLLSCNNLASGVHYPCLPDKKAKLTKKKIKRVKENKRTINVSFNQNMPTLEFLYRLDLMMEKLSIFTHLWVIEMPKYFKAIHKVNEVRYVIGIDEEIHDLHIPSLT
ncbi:hypothetical protein Syun_029517 [Stephania yunnanensis]|uniref:Uncharacterized protein n=1 Tax=Stephania yunnanensis TaxID=152371 RepID=A0AAP0E8R5_9MAGN